MFRNAVENFKLGVLGASSRGRKVGAWVTVVCFALIMTMSLVLAVVDFTLGGIYILIGVFILALAAINVGSMLSCLDSMASIERSHRRMEDHRRHLASMGL